MIAVLLVVLRYFRLRVDLVSDYRNLSAAIAKNLKINSHSHVCVAKIISTILAKEVPKSNMHSFRQYHHHDKSLGLDQICLA